jgi:hypothetical protein
MDEGGDSRKGSPGYEDRPVPEPAKPRGMRRPCERELEENARLREALEKERERARQLEQRIAELKVARCPHCNRLYWEHRLRPYREFGP